MTFPVSSAASQGARHTPPPPVDNAARAGARQADAAELALDVTQIALDIVGLVDPTPISDGANGLISLGRGDWLGAGISAVSMIPYVGDAAKLGKLGRYAETMANAVDLAKANPAIAKQLGPAMEKLREAFGHIPLDKLPQPMREALAPIKSKLDDFARIGVHTVQTTVGRNSVEWTQNAAGETIRANDLPPTSRTRLKLVKSVNHQENDGHEEEQIHRGTDHRLPQAGRGRHADQGAVPQWRFQ